MSRSACEYSITSEFRTARHGFPGSVSNRDSVAYIIPSDRFVRV